jgi:hypothetical protein
VNGRPIDPTAEPDHTYTGECAFVDEHAEGYALGALDRFERGLVEQHLRRCPRCRETVQAAEKVTAYLPFLSPPVAPPSDTARAALMERIAADISGPIIEVPPVSSRSSIAAAPVDAGHVPNTARRRRAQGWAQGWSQMLPVALIAPLTIALILALAWANSLRNTIEEQEIDLASQQQLNRAIANSGEVQLYSMEPRCDGCTGGSRLGIDKEDSIGMVVAWDLDPKQKLSVWCVNSKGDKEWVSSLEVGPDGGAMKTFDFPSDASEYTEVYIASDNGSIAYMTNIATPPARIPAGEPAPSTPPP